MVYEGLKFNNKEIIKFSNVIFHLDAKNKYYLLDGICAPFLNQ